MRPAALNLPHCTAKALGPTAFARRASQFRPPSLELRVHSPRSAAGRSGNHNGLFRAECFAAAAGRLNDTECEFENEAVPNVFTARMPNLRRSAPPPCPRLRKQTGARADREADETAKVTPAAIPPSRTGAQERGAAKKAKRVVQTSKLKKATTDPPTSLPHPEGRRRPAANRRRSETINRQPLSARGWLLPSPKRARPHSTASSG